ncbi:MAG: hypothetical protein KG075_00010 [Alphaproteobacteria bacterium]|nr:hypothetical protein [Alphaproteobacteria bacterium]
MTQPDHGIAAPPSQATAKASPARIPWREIARRLAGGAQPAALAPEYGIDEDRIWRHLRKSLRFRFYLQQAVDRQRLLAGLQLAATAPGALVSRGQQAASLDGEGLRLLAEAGGGSVPPEGGTQKQIEQLGETAALPPNMAWRTRMAVERRAMDLEAAGARGFLDGLNSGLARAAQATAVAAGPGSVSNRPDSTPTGPESAPNRPESVSDRPDSIPNRPDSASSRPDSAPPGPRLRPSAPRAEPPRYTVVDLDGPDLQRLRAAGLLGDGRMPDS